ncbi:RNA-directed DNA polymerase, eukaryota, reverse transcriptase zinc-binding domain protein [Tanacetum coccineum]|uniref:RNA-directed DNA polymerase, eukaryota, reverse transcriptase zinc-binding domain protein n=1 Tax=Tanacetum coccineum TaxID=301880 RepID=A0ABQ5A0T9_9ASTR
MIALCIGHVSLSEKIDSWKWSIDGSTEFTVASVRDLVDSNILDVVPVATRWNRSIPIKVNVFLWRLKLNRLPTRVNLDRKGIDIGSILCPICHDDIETANHIFFNCGMAQDLWALLAKWWGLDIPLCVNISEWFDWLEVSRIPSKACSFLDGVGGTLLWTIWNYRNRLLFSSSPPKKSVLMDSRVSQSFLWISSRNPNLERSWGKYVKEASLERSGGQGVISESKSNKASWVKVEQVLTSKDKGGFKVSSCFASLLEVGEFEQGCFWWSSNLLDIEYVHEVRVFTGPVVLLLQIKSDLKARGWVNPCQSGRISLDWKVKSILQLPNAFNISHRGMDIDSIVFVPFVMPSILVGRNIGSFRMMNSYEEWRGEFVRFLFGFSLDSKDVLEGFLWSVVVYVELSQQASV